MKEEFESGKDHVPLFDLVNKEQLLHMALEVINSDDLGEEYKEIAVSITHWYILNQIIETQETFTEDEINDKFNELITGHILNNMVKKGLIQENIPEDGEESTYSLTIEGQYLSKLLYGDQDGN